MSDGETKATEVESGSQGAQWREFDPPSFPAVAATRPVTVHAFPSGGYVWEVAAAEQIRLVHGIVGTMAGCLPGFALQNKVKGLPLLLSLEELAAAATMGVARLQVQSSGNHPNVKARIPLSADPQKSIAFNQSPNLVRSPSRPSPVTHPDLNPSSSRRFQEGSRPNSSGCETLHLPPPAGSVAAAGVVASVDQRASPLGSAAVAHLNSHAEFQTHEPPPPPPPQQQNLVLSAETHVPRASENMGEHDTKECGELHRMAASFCSHPCVLASTCPHQPPCSVPHALHAAREASFSEKFRLPVTEGDVQVAAEWLGAKGCGVQRQGDGDAASAGMGECDGSAAVADCSKEKDNGGRGRDQTGGQSGGAIGRERHDDDREGVSNGMSATSPSTCHTRPPSSPSLPLSPPHARTPLLSVLASLLHSSSPAVRLRCLVYADLLARSCRMTCGLRFGAHWLVYPGGADPCDLHAPCMLRVQRQHEGLSAQQLLAAARVAMASRKRLVLATASEELLHGEGFWEWFVERYGAVQVERRGGEEGERLVRGSLEDGLGGAEQRGLVPVGKDVEAGPGEFARPIGNNGVRLEQRGVEAGECGAAESRGMCGGEQGWEKQDRERGECVRGGKWGEWVEYTTMVTDLDFLPLELRTQNPLKAKMLQEGQQVGARRNRKPGAV
ncbi:unnamed protein product [Closterium sp. Yama58-4]|nr:unnamed protein product [Closterium sp. Yama58-4]